MASRDRTKEFNTILTCNLGPNIFSTDPLQVTETATHFTAQAKNLGRDLGDAYQKLEKLSSLASQSKLFDDHSGQIQDLTQDIRLDLQQLNNKIANLKNISSEEKNKKKNTNKQNFSNNVVLWLQSRLANASQNFRSVLEHRTERLKAQKSRRDEYFYSGSGDVPKNGIKQRKSNLMIPPVNNNNNNNNNSNSNNSNDLAIDIDSGFSSASSEASQQQLMLPQSNVYFQERAETMENIETIVAELAQIFRQLAVMIKEQEEEVIRIDNNVSDVAINVDSAHVELLKYLKSVSSGRWLMVKVFVVIVIFVIIFLVILT